MFFSKIYPLDQNVFLNLMHVPNKLISNQLIWDHAIAVRMLSVLLMDNANLNMKIIPVYAREERVVRLAEYA